MIFKKIMQEETLKQKSLNYWEESSYMLVPVIDNELSKDTILNRLSKIDNLNVKGFAEPSDDKPGRVVFSYNDNSYDFNYYVDTFSVPDLYLNENSGFTESEILEIKKCKNAIVIFMDYTENFKLEYKVQLTIAYNIVDKLYCIVDESSEKIMHPNYVKMIINSKYLPNDDSLYTVQAIVDNDNIWLHTHGLLRCGITELEILNSNRKMYYDHYNVISTLATHLIDDGINEENKYNIGFLSDGTPLIVTLKIWTEALKIYEGIDLGGVEDRKVEHNTDRSVIFVYQNEDDIENNNFNKIEVLDSKWGEDPVFFITTKETLRMKNVAQERFDYVKKAFNDKADKIIIKIGVKTDDDSDNYEHMWFKLLDISDDNIKVELLSSPYNVSYLHVGDITTYKISDITDWRIYTKDADITPDNVYLLD